MKDEPAIVIALSSAIVALLTACGLALSDQVKLAIPVLVAGLVLPLIQGLLTRWAVFSPLTAEQLARAEPGSIRDPLTGRYTKRI